MSSESPFFRRFPGDPHCVRTPSDTETVERISIDARFPCRSTPEALITTVNRHRDEIALTFLPHGDATDNPQRWTYGEYWAEIVAAANLFNELGLSPDKSVALLLPNIPEILFAIWGAETAGIAAPINPFLRAEQIANIAREADACILVTLGPDQSPELWQKALEAQRLVPSIKHLITIGGKAEGSIGWTEATARQPCDALNFDRPLRGDETASYFHTGGTTGTPKLARRTHRAEIVNVCQMIMTGVQEEDLAPDRSVILCGLPLFHVSAYVASALTSIVRGGEMVLAGPTGFRNKDLIRDFWPLVERYRVTAFAVVPTVYAALLDQPSADYDISSLRVGGCGGAPLSVNLLREFRERTGADIIEGYGMTESTACATTHAYRGDRKLGSVGIRLPYQKIRIVILNNDGSIERDCGIDEIGVILLSGPNVIPEYKQRSANEHAWPEAGWLNSGDMGRCDADGYYWLTGRSKDLIIRGGHNIDPLITEDALTSHPDVMAAAAVGKPDAYAGELPVAYVQLCPGAHITAEELVAYAREHAAERAAAPVEVIVCDTLPQTAVGKIYKPDLRKDAIARAYHMAAAAALDKDAFTVQVEDDKISGVKVILRPASPALDIDKIREKVSARLDMLNYKWEVSSAV